MKFELRKNNKSIHQGNVLFSWIKITFIVTVICIAFIMVSYNITGRLIKEQIAAINTGLTAQIQSRVDNQFIEIQSIGVEISDAAFTAVVIGSVNDGFTTVAYAYRDMVDYFRVIRATHTYIEEICLIFPDEDLFVNEDGVIKWTESGIPDDTKLLFIEYSSGLADEPVWNRIGWITDPEKNLFFMKSLPLPDYYSPAFLVIKIDGAMQDDILNAAHSRYSSIQFVTDWKRDIIFKTGGFIPQELFSEGESLFSLSQASGILKNIGALAVMKSEFTDLYCCSFIPEAVFLSDLNRLKSIFLTVSLSVVLLCLLLVCYFIIIHYLPLKKIISGFEGELDILPEAMNEYKRIEEYSGFLLSENKINSNRLADLEERIRNHNLEKFLKGFISYEDLDERLRKRLLFSAEWILAYIRISASDYPAEVISLYLAEISIRLPSGVEFVEYINSEGAVFVLIRLKERTAAADRIILKHFEQSCRSMEGIAGYSPVVVISRIFSPVTEISSHYRQCRLRMQEAEFFLQNAVVQTDVNKTEGVIFLDSVEQRKLADAVLTGDHQTAMQVVNSVLSGIDKEDNANADSVRYLLFSILTVIIQTVSETPAGRDAGSSKCTAAYSNFFRSEDIKSMKNALYEILKIACKDIAEKRNDHRQRLFRQIIEFVDDNLSEKTMFTPSVAEAFGMNPKYLSSFFKENNGTGLSEYIREERIVKACLLLEDDYTVKEIAELTGFSNIISFNRTFKRIKKITPTEYRREMVMKNKA